ncbi:MAG TPA: hypothetical protein VGD42_16100 [Lysobacter sp.]
MKRSLQALPFALALALLAPVASAQNNTLQPPPRVAPIPPPPSPVGVDRSRDASLDKLNRDLDAASRRVQSDSLNNQIQRGNDLMESDRLQTQRRAAGASPAEAARIRQEYEVRRAREEAWRTGKEQQRQRLDEQGNPIPPPPPPNEVKAPQIQPRR